MTVAVFLYLIHTVYLNGTGEPVLSGIVLGGHPVVSGQFSKSRKFPPKSLSFSPLLSGHFY